MIGVQINVAPFRIMQERVVLFWHKFDTRKSCFVLRSDQLTNREIKANDKKRRHQTRQKKTAEGAATQLDRMPLKHITAKPCFQILRGIQNDRHPEVQQC